MTEPRFICDCGWQDKSYNSKGLVAAAQVHLRKQHHKWPSVLDLKLNPSKWGVRLINFDPRQV